MSGVPNVPSTYDKYAEHYQMFANQPARTHCPVLRQYGHCGKSEACKTCNRLK